jgi:hypothetical protein
MNTFLFFIYFVVGIIALVIIGNIIIGIINFFSGKGKKGTVTGSIQYMGKDEYGKDKYDISFPGNKPTQRSSKPLPPGAIQYVGKDENGNNKYEIGV